MTLFVGTKRVNRSFYSSPAPTLLTQPSEPLPRLWDGVFALRQDFCIHALPDLHCIADCFSLLFALYGRLRVSSVISKRSASVCTLVHLPDMTYPEFLSWKELYDHG